jgi:hypothetical protein
MKTLGQDNQSPGQDSNGTSPEYNLGSQLWTDVFGVAVSLIWFSSVVPSFRVCT